jgi:uncharacterized membrane protein
VSASVPPPVAKPRARVESVDWLRGWAVVLMIQTHLYDAWCNAAAKATEVYAWSRWLGGVPSRLFLLLVGVSMAIKYEAQIAKGIERATMVRGAAKRGLEIVGLAYLFRIQEYVLGGFYDWRDIFRVDILNCIGASMFVAAFIAAPRRGKPAIVVCLAVAAVCIALGPIVGPHHFPDWLPRPLTSYLGGERPMSWFPLFPWLAWVLIGVAVGHYWVRAGSTPRRQATAFVITALVGVAMTGTVMLIRRHDPQIIRYPSEIVQQMGPGTFFYRLGTIGPMALAAYLVTRFAGSRFSVMQQLGKTSLLVYWVHVELVYGHLFGRLHHKLSFAQATLGFVLMTAAMLALSLLRTKYWRGLPRRKARPMAAAAGQSLGFQPPST